jgi:Cu-processing system ATP-binding protein
VTVVLTSHILSEIQERVDRLAIMATGKIRAVGTVQALREQMDLPLWIDLRIAPSDFEAVRTALGQLPVSAIEAHDDHVSVRCARDAKMAVIEALAALDGRVLDLHVREPSLEDVFFGFSD